LKDLAKEKIVSPDLTVYTSSAESADEKKEEMIIIRLKKPIREVILYIIGKFGQFHHSKSALNIAFSDSSSYNSRKHGNRN
jgi:GTPase Era involved in 16S rRNA processing